MTTQYEIINVLTLSQPFSYENGANFDDFSENFLPARFVGTTIASVLEKVADSYGLDMNEYQVSENDPSLVTFQRLEDETGCFLSESEEELWKQGKFDAWLVEYTMTVEKVVREEAVVPIASELA